MFIARLDKLDKTELHSNNQISKKIYNFAKIFKGAMKFGNTFYITTILFVALLFSQQYAFPQAPTAYAIVFTDKPHYEQYYSSSFLSPRAIANRKRLNIPITKEDYPIDTSYIATVLKQDTAIKLLTQSKWMNYIVISCNSSALTSIGLLPFVKEISSLHTINYKGLISDKNFQEIVPRQINVPTSSNELSVDTAYYGVMYQQIKFHNGHYLHHAGYKGEGMLIALLDAGYENVNSFPIFEPLRTENRLVGYYDFVQERNNMFSGNSHGMSVLSLMGGKIPYTAVGTAPNADYILMKTEANSYEEILEEYFLVAGLECADSLGVDVVNISLGYSEFDTKSTNHTFSDLDGLHSVASIAAGLAVKKGMLISNSAGNEGDKKWHYVTIPSDGYNVLSIAAVNTDRQLAGFSSRGSTLFDRTKPSLASVGFRTYAQKGNGTIGQGNGTSYSSPVNAGLMACLRQAFPDVSNFMILEAILQSCDRYHSPDTLTGYGVPDYWLAYRILEASQPDAEDIIINVYPNPVHDILTIRAYYPYNITKINIANVFGQLVYSSSYKKSDSIEIDFSSFASGIYVLQIYTPMGLAIKKIIKL